MNKKQQTRNVAEDSLPQQSATPMQKVIAACSGSLLTSLFIRLQSQGQQPTSNVKLHSPLKCCREVLFVAQNTPQQYVCLHQHVSNKASPLNCFSTNATIAHNQLAKNRFGGTWDIAVKIVRNEGITSLWKGLSPALVMSVPTTVIYFVGYDHLRDTLWKNWKWKYSESYSPMVAGVLARTLAVTFVSPLELLRTRMQGPEGVHGARKVVGGVRNMVKVNGISSLWRGLESSLFRDVPFSALYWTGYEMLKRNLNNYLKNNNLEGTLNTLEVAFLCGATSGMDGIVLGADTRATEGPIVADKNCEKIHYLAPNMYCCGAGTAADTEYTTALISSKLELHRLTTGRQARVVTAMTMLKQMLFRLGYIGAALIVGGYDVTGPNLFTVHPHGSTDKLPYVTMGSGSLAAMSIFESRWVKDMERQDAIDLVRDAIEAGIFNDLGSGSNVDVVVLEKDKTDILRNYAKPNERAQKEQSYKYKRGTTAFLKESIKDLVIVTEGEAMDIS
ncbi:6834_t:CDS:10 [Acaulospora colombiana]|uniref:6834_t:CDS:1 n=1 Tax=Acaulospora colombiana TaxID=27376 RepID=A0ACA9K6L0_9GLOM|nr:6834_t:CDS:10 [Acaulospora colombiana]